MSCCKCHVNAAFRGKGNEPQFQNGTHKKMLFKIHVPRRNNTLT